MKKKTKKHILGGLAILYATVIVGALGYLFYDMGHYYYRSNLFVYKVGTCVASKPDNVEKWDVYGKHGYNSIEMIVDIGDKHYLTRDLSEDAKGNVDFKYKSLGVEAFGHSKSGINNYYFQVDCKTMDKI